MRDAFITASTTSKLTTEWINSISENLINMYTPGFRENKTNFKTFLDGSIADVNLKNLGQGKSTPGTSDENIFLEGKGYFVIRDRNGKISYTRLGDFKFDGEGVYRSSDGQAVQGYILNDQGEIMNGTKPVDSEDFIDTPFNNGSASIPTTNIKLWIDPSNGKYLGKYEEFEFKDDGILYGKADNGKIKTPLFKVAIINFNNPQELFEIQQGRFVETPESGRAIIGRGEVRGGLIEMSNVDFGNNTTFFQQAQTQKAMADQIIKTHKTLLQNTIDLMSQ